MVYPSSFFVHSNFIDQDSLPVVFRPQNPILTLMQSLQELLQAIVKIEDTEDMAVAFKKLKREYSKVN